MEIREGIFTDCEYFLDRTKAWNWFGTPRWWEIFVEFHGLNGMGGAWLSERWRWNGSNQTIIESIYTLSYEKTEEIITKLKSNEERKKENRKNNC